MKDTNYISNREYSTIYNNFMDGKKVTNKIFVGNMCDANRFSTTKMRKLCFDAILFYLRNITQTIFTNHKQKGRNGKST